MRVAIESPFSGDVTNNRLYALRCLRHSLLQGESPFLSHLLYPLVSRDFSFEERERGMTAGREWTDVADLLAAYVDHGVTEGMARGIARAERLGITVERRTIGK